MDGADLDICPPSIGINMSKTQNNVNINGAFYFGAILVKGYVSKLIIMP
jgi:hypothetical protein